MVKNLIVFLGVIALILVVINVFNKEDPGKGILIRLDDKLKRIKESPEVRKNDIADLMGYLALYCVAEGWVDFTDQID